MVLQSLALPVRFNRINCFSFVDSLLHLSPIIAWRARTLAIVHRLLWPNRTNVFPSPAFSLALSFSLYSLSLAIYELLRFFFHKNFIAAHIWLSFIHRLSFNARPVACICRTFFSFFFLLLFPFFSFSFLASRCAFISFLAFTNFLYNGINVVRCTEHFVGERHKRTHTFCNSVRYRGDMCHGIQHHSILYRVV